MKNNMKPSFYYSAYPLKTVEQAAEPTQQPHASHLKVLSTKTKNVSRMRLYPMLNPYKRLTALFPRLKRPKDIEPNGKDWFNHYE